MEAQKFEELEEVEHVDGDAPEEAPALKEYEKLLLAETNRELFEKAVTLIKCGCFDQHEDPTVNFEEYTKIETATKFKGLYDLYQNNTTMELVFICPLVENNQGDAKEERANMAPYAYDMIVVEAMDEETYQMVKKAAKNNISSFIGVAYILALVFYGIYVAFTLFVAFDVFFQSIDANGFWTTLYNIGAYAGALAAGGMVALPLLILMSIKYKQYKEQ